MADKTNRIRVAVLGASGYTGGELLRLAAHHPQIDVVAVTAERHAGEPLASVFPHLSGSSFPSLVPLDGVDWRQTDPDIVFCALPYGASHDVARELLDGREVAAGESSAPMKIIDLSPDFRLADVGIYAEWYGEAHGAPRLQAEAVYGLTEFTREALKGARLIACPGCYPTASLLGLVPLIEAGQIAVDDIIIDAKSGVTGAGRAPKEANLFAEVAEGVHAYSIAGHRHMPEIEQELSRAAGAPMRVNFTPHLMPMNRGLQATIYVRLAHGAAADDLRETLSVRYRDEPFVSTVAAGDVPATRHVRGSNHCLIGVFPDRLEGRAIIVSVLDNLVKGGAGQAVQNMNLACGLPETTGLDQVPLFP